jgi:hypothetical protein
VIPRREIAEDREDQEWAMLPNPVIGKSNYETESQPNLVSRKRARFDESIDGKHHEEELTTPTHELAPITKSAKTILGRAKAPLQDQLIPESRPTREDRIVNP